MPLVEVGKSADEDFNFLDVALRDADEGSFRSGLRSIDHSGGKGRCSRATSPHDPISNVSDHSLKSSKGKEYDPILTKKFGDSHSHTPFAEATFADEVAAAPQPEETSSEGDQISWLESEVARLKLDLANAKAARDWHHLRFRKAQTEFEDLQAYCKKLQFENEQLKSKVPPSANDSSWFGWMQSSAPAITNSPPKTTVTPLSQVVHHNNNGRRGSLCSELTPDNDDVGGERQTAGSWWLFGKFEEANEDADHSERSAVMRSTRKNSLVIESLDADEPGEARKTQYRSTTDGHLVGLHMM